MEISTQALLDSARWSAEEFYSFRKEAAEAWDFYNNRQWSEELLAILESRGQPKETYNVIKSFSRIIQGYFTSSVTQIRARARHEEDTNLALVMTDVLQYILHNSKFNHFSSKVLLDGILSGILCCEVMLEDTGEVDGYGKNIQNIKLAIVPSHELLLDPSSFAQDSSDKSFIHRFKWIRRREIESLFDVDASKMNGNVDYLSVDEADYSFTHLNSLFNSRINYASEEESFLVVHSQVYDDDGKLWSIFWHDDVILEKEEITDTGFSYIIIKTSYSNIQEYYGLFREIIETQKAINQAIVKLQLMVNSSKIFVEEGAVNDMEKFIASANKVTGVTSVKRIEGIKVHEQAREVTEQYAIVEAAYNRAKNILNITDSFLGQAAASDSGRKVKLQQNTTQVALNYLMISVELFYESLGYRLLDYVRKYYGANRILQLTDEKSGQRFIEINKPLTVNNASGQQINLLDPQSNTGETQPLLDPDTAVTLLDAKISIDITPYADEDERTQLFLETIIAGPVGQSILQLDPSIYLKLSALLVGNYKTKLAPEIKEVIMELSNALAQSPDLNAAAAEILSGIGGIDNNDKSRELKLPTNTNEKL